MAGDEPRDGARLTRSARHQDELSRLGRAWFAEANAQSEREAAEFATWRKEHRKWSVFDKRSGFNADSDRPSGDDAS